jgi:hypothetical protein
VTDEQYVEIAEKPASGQDSWRPVVTALGWVALYLLVMAGLQLVISYPLDDDTAYHFSVARLIREQGILHSFPWTRFSWQFDHYADKEFLFHLLFVPIVHLGFNNAARIVGIAGGTAILSSIFLVLRSERVRFAGWWALLPLGTAIFVYRFSQVRPHLLSIALAIVMLWAYSRRHHILLVLTAVLYPLTYVAFWQIPLLLVLAAEGGRLLSGKQKFDVRLPLLLSGGLALGILLHPNTVNLLRMNWIHMVDVLMRNAWGGHIEFNMGEEFEPFYPGDWLEFLLPPAVMAALACYHSWRCRRESAVSLAFSVATLVFCLLTARTNRFLEYMVPFSVVSVAMISGRLGRNRRLLTLMFALSFIHTVATGIPTLKNLAASERTWQMSGKTISGFDRQLPKGATVFTCGWEYTGSLLLNLPGRLYMVALDPTLLYKRDPQLYDLWYRTLKEAPESSADAVRSKFDSRYVVCLDHPTLHSFFDALASSAGVNVLYSDGKWVLFDLGTGKTGR